MSFLDIPVSHGRLEALLWTVEGARAAAVVCHPHPLHGGTMHNHVTYRLADAFRKAGVCALRFNFRGVGRSSGQYDEGRGEVDDARAALDFLQQQQPGVPLLLAGFSFGSRVALQLALEDVRVERVLAAGVALRAFSFGLVQELKKPKAFIQGDRDEYAALEDVQKLVERAPPPRKLFVVPDCDHLATGRLDAFEQASAEAVAWLLAAPPR
ncbi:MAG TPA: alpha/beta fold hydrolase [Myxococcales bacterium]|nr:alpha/beta fold hydrolase [Myxococcales bacterium]